MFDLEMKRIQSTTRMSYDDLKRMINEFDIKEFIKAEKELELKSLNDKPFTTDSGTFYLENGFRVKYEMCITFIREFELMLEFTYKEEYFMFFKLEEETSFVVFYSRENLVLSEFGKKMRKFIEENKKEND